MLNKLKSRLGLLRGVPEQFIGTFERRPEAGPIETSFGSHQGRRINKWQHYLPIYDRLFAAYRDKSPRMLEIGVADGGSLELWREYFGEKTTLFGIDINPDCADFNGEAGQVRIGSQADPSFLRSVVSEMGGLDIVLDDGSHNSLHMRTSFKTLFPLLSDGGLYVVEDTHCCYWKGYGGGYRKRSSFIEFSKGIVDDLHRWYHPFPASTDVASVQFFDSMIVFEKGGGRRPAIVTTASGETHQ